MKEKIKKILSYKFVKFLLFILIFIILPIRGCYYASTHMSDVDLVQILEKHTRGIDKVKLPVRVSASDFLKELFPDTDLKQYDVVCVEGLIRDDFLPFDDFQVQLEHPRIKSFIINYSENNLLYPPLYVFISNKERNNIKHVSINHDYAVNYYYYKRNDLKYISGPDSDFTTNGIDIYINQYNGHHVDCEDINKISVHISRGGINFLLLNEK